MRKKNLRVKNNKPSLFSRENKPKKDKHLFLLIVSAVLIVLPFFLGGYLGILRSLGLAGFFLLNFLGTATVFFPAPVILSVGVASSIYDPLLVAAVASLAQALGESTGYVFGHSSKEIIGLKRRHTIIYNVLYDLFKKYGVLFILIFSFIPNPFMDGIGIIAGVSAYPLTRFFAIVFAGRLVRNIGIAYLAAAF